MKITKEQIKKFNPCDKGYKWYLAHGSEDLLKTLLDVNKVSFFWAAWLYVQLMSPKQQHEFTLYVLDWATDNAARAAEAVHTLDYELGTAYTVARDLDRSKQHSAAFTAKAFYYLACINSNVSFAAGAASSNPRNPGSNGNIIRLVENACAAAERVHTDENTIAMQEKLIRKAVKILDTRRTIVQVLCDFFRIS